MWDSSSRPSVPAPPLLLGLLLLASGPGLGLRVAPQGHYPWPRARGGFSRCLNNVHILISSVQFSHSVVSDSLPPLWTVARRASLKSQFMEFSRQEYQGGWLFPSPGDHILSDLSTMTRLSWVAPRAWLSFIELDKAVVLV